MNYTSFFLNYSHIISEIIVLRYIKKYNGIRENSHREGIVL